MKAGIYVHIPFCVRKCHYCSFNSIPYEKETSIKYLDALSLEISSSPVVEATSIYVGGGTPTVLPARGLYSLIDTLRERFKAGGSVEFTLEANPGTLEGLDFSAIRSGGVNRISLGVQSFDPTELRALGRVHGASDVGRSVRKVLAAGIDNINLDLIYSLPGQDMGSWRRSLEEAVSLGPAHISLYDLSLEAGTHLYSEFKAGRVVLPPETVQVDMYLHAVDYLFKAGYLRYEISNFAKPGNECRHNLGYWSADPYLGLGAGACSRLGSERTVNIGEVREYLAAINSGRSAVESREELTPEAIEREFIMLGLRKAGGFGLDEYLRRFGQDFTVVHGEEADRLVRAGHMRLEGGRASLTIKGVLASNAVIREFF